MIPRTWSSFFRALPGNALLAGFFALADMRLVAMLMPREFVLSAQVADAVLQRQPMWRVYQSRVLSPALVRFFGGTADLGRAYAWFAATVLFLAGLSVLMFANRLRDGSRRPLAAFLAFHVAVLLLLPGLWIYPWDLLSLLAFTWFNILALRGGPLLPMAVLFAFALPNHEVALVIAGWLVLDPVVRWGAGLLARQAPRFDAGRFVVGALLVAAGGAVVEVLRTTLLVRETQPPGELPPFVRYGRDFHFTLVQNLHTLGDAMSLDVSKGFQVVVPLFLFMVAAVAFRLLLTRPARHGALAFTTLAMLGSFLCFGLVFETRVLMPLVPFMALNGPPPIMKAAARARSVARGGRLQERGDVTAA
jgi:hypothetical protein